MDVRASLRYLRISPRKVRLVLGLIRGKDVVHARVQLENLPKRSSQPILKLLSSAEANAQNNFKLDPKSMYIKGAYADEGPKLKRFTPRAMGRATPVLKRMSHVTLILSERPKAALPTPAKGRPGSKQKPVPHTSTKTAPPPKKTTKEKAK